MKNVMFIACIYCLTFSTQNKGVEPLLPGEVPSVQSTDTSITIDCQQSTGRLRPLHGLNGGFLVRREFINLSSYWNQLGVPITRLHDMPWCADEVVDIHTIFPDMSKDPAREESYSFKLTDDFIQPIVTGKMDLDADLGRDEDPRTEIVYRLGESIEHSRRKTYVHPPVDLEKWSDICVGIVRHYNEGWADGYHDKIKYWEIWNEAENQNPPTQWTGTDEAYFKLYATTARKLKSAFPELKIGGPSCGVQGEFIDDRFEPSQYLKGFMKVCVEQNLPVDFFSWHTYSNHPALFKHKAVLLRKWLDQNGYKNTEMHLNEWNYSPSARGEEYFNRMGGVEGAAFSAYVLLSLQNSPVDIANYYSGDVNPYGMFSAQAGAPKKVFHAFRAFRFLLNTPEIINTVDLFPEKSILTVAKNDTKNAIALMVANFNHLTAGININLTNLPWKGPTAVTTYLINGTNDFEEVETRNVEDKTISLRLCPDQYSVTVVQITPL